MPTPIIALSKDWHEDPTSNHHVLRELAKSRRVLWMNSVSTRVPALSSARDLDKMRRKLLEFGRGPVNVEHDLWIATPLVVPLPHNPLARIVNRRILRSTVRRLRAHLGIDRFQLWTFLPNTAPYVGTLGEALAVYYCVDEWATFPGLDAAAIRCAERELLRRVDVTFATSMALVEAKRPLCRDVHLARHGVDHASFARALDDDLEIPTDLAALRPPRIGFFGTLRDFIDVDAIAAVARARPDWAIALIGQVFTDLAPLRALPNVHLLGRKPHADLPAYCKGFDAALIPYRTDDASRFINPLKLREYLSAGLPVVSTAIREVEPYAHLCHIARTHAELPEVIERALAHDTPYARRRRSVAMRSETWSTRVAAVEATVAACERAKRDYARREIHIPNAAAVKNMISE
ncbi:MAG: glycosyltransferase [Deltaproteobacteria bacterium]|nr:glycosyltransferase [Deltaproteobacteria bacterium]